MAVAGPIAAGSGAGMPVPSMTIVVESGATARVGGAPSKTVAAVIDSNPINVGMLKQ